MAGSPFTLAAGASVRKSFAGINGGPAKIVSDVPIVAAERVVYYVDNVQTSYAEMMGLPDSQLNTIYWFPSYNNVDLDSQLRIGNVSSSTTTVRLYVAGVELTSGCTPYNSPIPLAAGASVRVSCSGVNNGPVKVVSDVPIVAAERIIYKVNNVFTSYVEMMGFPDSELDTIYWMPRYNNVDPLNTELILAVGGSTSSGGEGFTGMSSQLSEVLEGGSSLEIESASETESTFDPYEITVEDGSPFWQGLIPGASQDSLVTFTNLHTPVGEQHSNGVWGEDSIQVLYDTPNERIQIWTYSAEDGWVQRGEDIPVTFADGDVLRARALEDGTVEIYHNGALLIQQGAMGSKAPKGSWFARFVSYFLPAPLAQASDTHTPTATQTATPIETPTATLSLTASTTPTAIDTPAVTSTPSPTGTLTPGTSTALATLSPTGTMSPSHTPTATQTPVGPITIEYVYDPLNRLTEANYSNNDYYHYTYDAVGNRKTQQSLVSGVLTNDAYNYDIANRLTDVNGVLYPWDDNGNLRNDGVNTYGYDSANRLKTLTGPSVNAAYSYNGLGDRLQETLNGQTTTFIMDLNTDLTQALSDGTNTYIYGVDRIAQTQGGTTEYFLDDALGSVRQMTSASGTVTYASAYDPYGVTAQTYGASQTAYGFTGEFIDSYIKLIYLRSRWYDPASGRFPTKDSWQGDYNRPLSLNRWNYVEANPVNYTDPSGLASSAYSRLLEIRDEVAPNGAEALFRSFEDFELYTKWGNEAGRTSRARLEWLLKVTTGAPDPLTNAIAPVVLVNFAVDFGSDCGFAVEFRDSGFYGLWGKDPQDSNQVGHFLTAVNMTYYWELVHKSNAHPDSMAAHSRWALYPIIGHEQMSDDPPYNVAIQPSKPTTWDFILWDQAVEFDSKGQYQWRDDALWAILNFPANIPMGGVDRRRVGNSLQDLRLSLKGYRFAHWVWDNPTTHPAQAGRWLSLNRQHIPDQKKFGGADR